MTPVRLGAVLLLGLVLLASPASAAAARGELAAGAAALSSDASLASAGLDVLSVGSAAPALSLELTGVSVQRLGWTSVRPAGPVSTSYQSGSIDERASFESARVTLEAGEGVQRVSMRALGAATALVPGATVRGVGGALLATTGLDEGDRCPTEYADYCHDVFGVYEVAGDAQKALVGGEIRMLLYGPTLVVESAGERATFASGAVTAQDAVAAAQTEDAWVLLVATGGSGSIEGALSLFSAAPTLRASSIVFDNADGALRVGAMEYRAAGDDVSAAGELLLTPGPVSRADDHGLDGQAVYASAFTTRVQGDVESISLRGAPAFLDSPAEKAGAAALLAAAIAGIAYAWQHIGFGVAALYTRLNKPDILDNDVRNRIYDIIRDNPGISAREVHRRSEQSWGTVVYHLRQLERHHLVVSRALGRTRNYYENHGKYRGMEVQLACLQSERALTLARAIVGRPGITQEQLAEVSGFPQPTTSYYVRKLKQAGLVEEQREGRYVKYVPHLDLPRFVALADHQPTVGGASASGVQA